MMAPPGPPVLRYGAGLAAVVDRTAAAQRAAPTAGLRARLGPAQPPLRLADPAALHTLGGATMGTTWSVRLFNPGYAPLAPVRAAIEAVLDEVLAQMSHWRPDSDLSRYSAAPAGSWHTWPEGLEAVVQAGLHWARASGGAFDPTVAPLVRAWGFGPWADERARRAHPVPDATTLAHARQQVGHQRLQYRDAAAGPDAAPGVAPARQWLQPGGLALDLSGIAKGHAVDRVLAALRAHGFEHALVEVGGELRAAGQRPGGQPWQVAVADPGGPEGAVWRLPLRDLAVATSGDAWHAFEWGGRRYSHTLDPRSGWPVPERLASVTVLHPECLHADALATLLGVLGVDEGQAFAEHHGVAACWTERGPTGCVRHASADWQRSLA